MQVIPASCGYYPNHAGNTRGYQGRVAGIAGSGKTRGYPQEKKPLPITISNIKLILILYIHLQLTNICFTYKCYKLFRSIYSKQKYIQHKRYTTDIVPPSVVNKCKFDQSGEHECNAGSHPDVNCLNKVFRLQSKNLSG